MKILMMLLLLFWSYSLHALSLGSKTAASVQGLTIFPANDTNNTMLGYSRFESGFTLQDNKTSCTFDCFIPVSGPVSLNGGRVFLFEDLVFSNTLDFQSGGRFYGNRYSIELPKHVATQYLPTNNASSTSTSWTQITSTNMSAGVNSTDWIKDDNYVGASSYNASGGQELKVYYFDGSTLTTTQSIEFGKGVYSIRWHPTQNYAAVGADSGSGNELFIYKFNISNGTFTQTYAEGFGSYVASEIWHPSGNYLIVASPNDGGPEIISYSFNQTTGVLTSVSTINLPGNNGIQRDSVTFAPGGNRFVVGSGSNFSSGLAEIFVCSFSGTSIAVTTSVDINRTCAVADWCPTGSYIAAGLSSGTQSLRIYKHSLTPSESLSLVSTALIGEVLAVNDLNWSHDGNYLAVGTSGGMSSSINIYYFDKTSETLALSASIPTLSDVNSVRWAHNDSYISYANDGNEVIIIGINKGDVRPLIFDTATLVLNAKTVLQAPTHFIGNCKINGRGKRLKLGNGASLLVRPNAQLVLEDVEIQGIKSNYLRCMTDNGSLVLRNCILQLDSDFTFSRGAILFEEDVVIAGTSKFVYSSALASTIASLSKFALSQDLTFSYAPRMAKRNLLFMQDSTSRLLLNGCTLHSTRTGLLLDRGTLMIDNKVTMSSEAKNSGEALEFGPNLSVQVFGGSMLDCFGKIKSS